MRRIILVVASIALLLIFVSNVALCETLELKSRSEIEFYADFYKAENLNSPAVLILPGMSGKRAPYTNFSKKLNKVGFNVLSINYAKLDNVSKNAKHRQRKKVLAKRGGTMGLVENEVAASLEFLHSQKSVDKNRIGILGMSMGTWTGFQSMAKFTDLKCLIMLSPICAVSGKTFQTYDGTIELAKAFGDRHLFLVASEKDRHSSKSPSAVDKSEYLISIMPDAKIEKKYYPGKSHAYFILKDHKEIVDILIKWLHKAL